MKGKAQSNAGSNFPLLTKFNPSPPLMVIRCSTMVALTAEDLAISITCTKHFHQALWLVETADHSKLRVTIRRRTSRILAFQRFCLSAHCLVYDGRLWCLTD